jgi:hypothetical protein
MNYRQFVKENFHKLGDMPAKDKMRKLGEMWRKSGHSKGGSVVGGATVGGRMRSKAKGKGFLSDMLGSVGLGVEPKKRGRKAKGKGIVGGDVAGGGFLDDILGGVKGAMKLAPLIGLGVKKRGRKAKGMGVAGGDVAGGDVAGGDVAGGSFFGDMFNGLKTGFALPFKAIGSLTGGDLAQAEHGSGIFSGLLGAIGLGMPEKTLNKHLNKMIKLDAKLHNTGKLTPKEHSHLKVYHHLHGSGFFDKLFSGAKKAVGAVVNNLDTIKKVVPEVAKFVPESVKSKLPSAVRAIAKV